MQFRHGPAAFFGRSQVHRPIGPVTAETRIKKYDAVFERRAPGRFPCPQVLDRYLVIGITIALARDIDTRASGNKTPERKARRSGVSTRDVNPEQVLYLRRNVANLYTEAVNRVFGRRTLPEGDVDPDKLRRVAKEMGEVGKTGKEGRAGWRKAIELIERALVTVRAERGAPERAEVLLELLEAQHALRDEQAVLRTLSEYMQTAPNSAEARTWLGNLHLRSMQLPREALLYYRDALKRNSRFSDALIGEGDALTYVGNHNDAVRSYSRAQGDVGKLRRAAAELRMAQVDRARGTAESILASDPANQEALLLRACALYTQGDLETARGAFEQLASMPSTPDSNRLRGPGLLQPRPDLCLRQGQHDAAMAAFDACEKALKQGASSAGPDTGRDGVVLGHGSGHRGLRGQVTSRAMRGRARPMRATRPRGAPTGELFARDGRESRRQRLRRPSAPWTRPLLNCAPGLHGELDRLARQDLPAPRPTRAVATGASAPSDTAETFERAIAFAERAADREARADRRPSWKQRLRECLVRIGAGPRAGEGSSGTALALAGRRRRCSRSARSMREQRGGPGASPAYCNFQLGLYDENSYDECIRQASSRCCDVVPEDRGSARGATWRALRRRRPSRPSSTGVRSRRRSSTFKSVEPRRARWDAGRSQRRERPSWSPRTAPGHVRGPVAKTGRAAHRRADRSASDEPHSLFSKRESFEQIVTMTHPHPASANRSPAGP